MKKTKCKLCVKYEVKEKEVGLKKLNVSDEIEIPVFHYWKFCKLKNNWCRNVAGNCGTVIDKNENKLEGEINEVF